MSSEKPDIIADDLAVMIAAREARDKLVEHLNTNFLSDLKFHFTLLVTNQKGEGVMMGSLPEMEQRKMLEAFANQLLTKVSDKPKNPGIILPKHMQ